jgi:hypothetical protein
MELNGKFTMDDFRNENDLVFKIIEDEQYRVYEFSDGGTTKIEEPLLLNVSPSGGHRIFDASGRSNYIPAGWKKLYWVVKEGRPHFAF